MSKNGSSLKLCSLVNFILGFWFWSKLCKSLILPHEHFQSIKQSSRYLFHELINSVFILLQYFCPWFHIDVPLSMHKLAWCILVLF